MKLIYLILLSAFSLHNVHSMERAYADTALFTNLKGTIPGLKDGEQIKLAVSDYYISVTHTTTNLTANVKDESFSFDLSAYDRPIYVTIWLPNIVSVDKNKNNLFRRTNFLVKPNDQVKLILEQNDLLFTGQNAIAYNIQYGLAKIEERERQKDAFIDFADITKIKDIFKIVDVTQSEVLAYLDDNRELLDELTYNTIKYNFILKSASEKYFLLNFRKIKSSDAGIPPIQKINIDSIYRSGVYFPNRIPSFLYEKFKYDSCNYINKPYQLGKMYNYIKQTYDGALKDYLLVYPIVKNLKSDSLAKYTREAIDDVGDDRLKSKLIELTAGVLEGQIVEDFSFHDERGNVHSLSDYKGKVIVMDFWFTGCMNCTQITPYLNRVSTKFEDDNVIFLSISIDKNTDLWKKSIREGSYSFRNSIKLFTSNQGDNHPVIKGFKIIGYPTIIILDKAGKLVRSPVDPRIDDCKDMIGLISEKLN